VTGRVTEENVSAPSEQESASKTNSHVPERTQQYYKASWRVQTNDLGGDDDKLVAVVASPDNPDSLSPRQTVLSSWNQKYQEEKQKTSFSRKLVTSHQTTNEKDDENKKYQGTVKHFPDTSRSPVPVSAPTAASKSVVSAWHQRVQEQQAAATTHKKGPERVVMGANKSVLAAWQQRSQQHHDPVTVSKSTSSDASSDVFSSQKITMESGQDACSHYGSRPSDLNLNTFPEPIVISSYPSEVQEEVGPFESGQGNVNLANASCQQSSYLEEDFDIHNATKTFSVDEAYPGQKEEQQRSTADHSNVESDSPQAKVGSGCSLTASSSDDRDITKGSTLSERKNTQPTEDFPLQELPQRSVAQATSSKPWEKDTKHSVVQSWQMRSAKTKESSSDEDGSKDLKTSENNLTEQVAVEECVESKSIEQDDEIVAADHTITSASSSYDFIDEKKSEDLSVNEDKILGIVDDDCAEPSTRERLDSSVHLQNPSKRLSYDDEDSYIGGAGSDEVDTVSQEMLASSSRTHSARSAPKVADLDQIDSEELSLYVEDSKKKSKSTVPVSTEETNLEENIFAKMEEEAPIEDAFKKEEANTTIESPGPVDEKKRAAFINPSPKDNTKYRMGYFGDESPSAARGVHRMKYDDNGKEVENAGRLSKPIEYTTELVDIWAVSSASQEEQDEAIHFDDTDAWLDRDPEIHGGAAGDDASVSSSARNTEPSESESKVTACFGSSIPILADNNDDDNGDDDAHPWGPPEADQNMIQHQTQESQQLKPDPTRNNPKVAGFDTNIPAVDDTGMWTPIVDKKDNGQSREQKEKKTSSKKEKQDVFDPFQDDDEDADDGLKIDIPNNLFSPNPDPFMTEESFSPLDWSSPRGITAQHIGYYNSPDSRLEI
jgi:hypothetical protein